MASNDSGLDSNDSNDGATIGIVSVPSESPSPTNPTDTTSPPRFSPSNPEISSLSCNMPAPTTHSWHSIHLSPFEIRDSHDFSFSHPLEQQPSMSIRPSSLPSGSHSYKMRLRVRAKQRFSKFPGLFAMCNGLKLRNAASTCNVELLTHILESGCDPDIADRYKRCPLHLAACHGYIPIVEQLLSFGANPNVVDSLGNTPLHLAVISASSNNYNSVVRILLQGGASVHMHDRSGKTPLDLAESKLRLLRARYHPSTPETAKILEDMCLLISLILRYMVQQQQDIEDLTTLEQQLQNLSTSDEPVQEAVVSQTADALLASVERLSLGK